MSLILRDQMIRECWVPASMRRPLPGPKGPHFPVSVVGVVDDRRLRLDGEQPFVDIVCWWPALQVWTVTLQCRADEDARDFVCSVSYWQSMFPLPL